MSILYSPPFVSGAIGDTLTFTMTGTTTPQDTYADPDLDTAHTNPVQADAEGNFPPIYFDPELPDYRVDYKNSEGVSYPGYPVNDVPSSQNQAPAYLAKGDSPFVEWWEADATTNNKRWRARVDGELWKLQRGTDAGVWTDIIQISRSGEVTIPSLVTSAGSFSGVLTGFASDPTPTVYYQVSDGYVRMWVETDYFATSDDTAMTLTGMPAELYPANTSITPPFMARDNGATVMAYAGVSGAGVATFVTAGNFTNSGSKGLPRGWTMGYPL